MLEIPEDVRNALATALDNSDLFEEHEEWHGEHGVSTYASQVSGYWAAPGVWAELRKLGYTITKVEDNESILSAEDSRQALRLKREPYRGMFHAA